MYVYCMLPLFSVTIYSHLSSLHSHKPIENKVQESRATILHVLIFLLLHHCLPFSFKFRNSFGNCMVSFKGIHVPFNAKYTSFSHGNKAWFHSKGYSFGNCMVSFNSFEKKVFFFNIKTVTFHPKLALSFLEYRLHNRSILNINRRRSISHSGDDRYEYRSTDSVDRFFPTHYHQPYAT